MPDDTVSLAISSVVERGFSVGKLPLFVLGAGISAKIVPFIGQMAERLTELLTSADIPDAMRSTLVKQGERIRSGSASRSDAAEFFSTCQLSAAEAATSSVPGVWRQFCEELAIKGLRTTDGVRFTGLFRLTPEVEPPGLTEVRKGPSIAHLAIASLLAQGACRVLNFNYDPLLYLAMAYLRKARGFTEASAPVNYRAIVLHTPEDIRSYYSSPSREFQPSVINARGDVFYARCTNERCPDFGKDRSLDFRFALFRNQNVFECATCHLSDSVQLQLSFPGYETKERLVQPVLQELQHFMGNRISVVIPIGLSGQWDPYLLSEIFNWSLAFSIPIVDVKPDATSDGARSTASFDRFRRRYFPSVPVGPSEQEPSWFYHWRGTADSFLPWLHTETEKMKVFKELQALPDTGSAQGTLPLD